MKRISLIITLVLSISSVLAQEQRPTSQPTNKADRKQAKRERINQMLRLEEEGEPSYRKHNIWGFKLNHDGYGASYEWAKMKSPYRATIYQVELNDKKHEKEEKQSTGDNIGGFTVLGNPFVYGKQNYFYQLKFGIGQQLMIGGKANKNGVGVYGVFAGGVSLGLLRPYYIEVESPINSGQLKAIKYSEADSAEFLNPASIVGGTGLSKGWGEMKFKPGVHAKTALRFDWGRFNNNVSAVEFGFNFEYYPQLIEQMATIEGKHFFVNGYLALVFGKRK